MRIYLSMRSVPYWFLLGLRCDDGIGESEWRAYRSL